MKRHYFFFLSCLLFCACLTTQKNDGNDTTNHEKISEETHNQSSIRYTFSNEYDDFDVRSLEAKVGEKQFTLFSINEEVCIRIAKQGDFNKNGYEDVLVEIINGCGGNCCGNSYVVFSYDGEKFQKTTTVGYDFNGIEVHKADSVLEFTVQTVNYGVGNTSSCDSKEETYRLNEYQLELIAQKIETPMAALKEIKAQDFENKRKTELILSHDIDGDSKLDKLICQYDKDFKSISGWRIEFANSSTYEGETTINMHRLGILSTKHFGSNDLVISCSQVLQWNGTTYEEVN